jgi:hypothetical protein
MSEQAAPLSCLTTAPSVDGLCYWKNNHHCRRILLHNPESSSFPLDYLVMTHQQTLTQLVGIPDYPSGISDMHTIHDPMISVSWIHISELITELHHPLQYQIMLTIGHMTKYDIATQGKSTTKQRIPNSVDDPRLAYYPTSNWLGDVPSSHRRRRSHHQLLSSLLHNLAKLIARDKAVSTFELYSQTI